MDAKEAQDFVALLGRRFPRWSPPQHVREQLCEALSEFEWTIACDALKRVCGKGAKSLSLQELLTMLRSLSNPKHLDGWPGYVEVYAVCITSQTPRIKPGHTVTLCVPASRPPEEEQEGAAIINSMRTYMYEYLRTYGFFEYEIYVGAESYTKVLQRRAELQRGE